MYNFNLKYNKQNNVATFIVTDYNIDIGYAEVFKHNVKVDFNTKVKTEPKHIGENVDTYSLDFLNINHLPTKYDKSHPLAKNGRYYCRENEYFYNIYYDLLLSDGTVLKNMYRESKSYWIGSKLLPPHLRIRGGSNPYALLLKDDLYIIAYVPSFDFNRKIFDGVNNRVVKHLISQL